MFSIASGEPLFCFNLKPASIPFALSQPRKITAVLRAPGSIALVPVRGWIAILRFSFVD